MISNNMPLYIIGRTMEGIGMGAAGPVSRTMMVNVFDRKELSKNVAIITGSAAMMPALAPIAGGIIFTIIGWRGIFGFLLLLASVYFYFAYRFLPSTTSNEKDKQEVSILQLLGTYFSVLKNRYYWGYTIPYSVMLGGLIGYYSAMPFWFHTQLGIGEHVFSYLAIPTVSMYVIGLVFSNFLIKKYELEDVFFIGILLAFSPVLISVLFVFLNVPPVVNIVIVMTLHSFSAGLIVPNANAGVLEKFKKEAAPTSALIGVIVFGMSSLNSSITMNLTIKYNILPLTVYLGVISLIGFITGYFWIFLPRKKGLRKLIKSQEESHQ